MKVIHGLFIQTEVLNFALLTMYFFLEIIIVLLTKHKLFPLLLNIPTNSV